MFRYWKKNRRQIKMTITHLNRFHLNALHRGSKLSEVSLDNIYSKLVLILWVSLLEVEFNILITEQNIFTQTFILKNNISGKSEVGKWISLIDYFFKEQYFHKQDRELDIINLGDINYHRYETLSRLIKDDLRPFIELRNRLAHGQWSVAFNCTAVERNQKLTTLIWSLSKKEIMLLKSFVANVPILVRMLISSRNTFERDYDRYINRIIKAKHDADMKYRWILGMH